MPHLLRHLLPLLIIGAMLLVSLLFTLTLIALLGRIFRRPEVRSRAGGPVIEGTATEVPQEPAVIPSPPARN